MVPSYEIKSRPVVFCLDGCELFHGDERKTRFLDKNTKHFLWKLAVNECLAADDKINNETTAESARRELGKQVGYLARTLVRIDKECGYRIGPDVLVKASRKSK